MAGTTVEEGGHVYRILGESVSSMGYIVDQKQLSQVAGMSKYEAIKLLLPREVTNTDRLVNETYQIFLQKLNHIYRNDPSIREKPGVSHLFTQLRKLGLLIALNTGYSREQADILIEKFYWKNLINFSITSDEVEQGRPHPGMIYELMKRSGIKNSKAVIKVGDTINDILEGKRAQCGLVVGVTGGPHDAQTLWNAGADLVLDKTCDLMDHLPKTASSHH